MSRPATPQPSDYVVQFGRALGSSVSTSTGAVLLNVEGVGGDEDAEGSVGVELYGALGLVGRPLPPDSVGGRPRHVEVLSVRTADALVPVAVRDVRLNQSFPNPKAGDVALVGYGSNFVKLAADGSLYLATTTDGTPGGQMVQLQHRGDGLAYVAPWGKLTFDQGGLHVLHPSGARLDLGGIGGLPAPLGALGSYASVAAALVKVQCAAAAVGPDAGLHDNAVKATPLEALLSAVASGASAAAIAETASAAAFTALGGVPALVAVSAPLGAAAAASTAAALALNAVAAAISAALPPASPTSVRSQSLTVT